MRKFYFTIVFTLFILYQNFAQIRKGYIIEIVNHEKHHNGISSLEYFNFYIDSSVDTSSLKKSLLSNIDCIDSNVLLVKVINSYIYNKNESFLKGEYADFRKIQNKRVYRYSNRKNNVTIKVVKGDFEFDLKEESIELFSKEFINISHLHMNIPIKNKNEMRIVAYLKSFNKLEILSDKEIKWFGLK